MRSVYAFLFLLLGAISTCSQKAAVTRTISFETVDNRPFVTVFVNGQKLHFVFDTGGINAIDKDVADRLGLRLENPGGRYSPWEEIIVCDPA
jgi:predicted aspartyl protease